MMKHTPTDLADFPSVTYDKIRYSDTDRQGHVNNAIFATFLETGRTEIFYHPEWPVLTAETSFVIAALQLDFLHEIKWPGRVEIGTGVRKVGTSSVTVFQRLYQHDVCVASAQTVLVQVADATGKSRPLSAVAKAHLNRWKLPDAAE